MELSKSIKKMRPCQIPIAQSVENADGKSDEINISAYAANDARNRAMINELCPMEREMVADALWKLSLTCPLKN